MNKHIILYSHGFGVRKDDRGLFTDIANSFTDVDNILFNYNIYDVNQNSLRVSSFTQQSKILAKILVNKS